MKTGGFFPLSFLGSAEGSGCSFCSTQMVHGVSISSHHGPGIDSRQQAPGLGVRHPAPVLVLLSLAPGLADGRLLPVAAGLVSLYLSGS